MDMPVKSTNSTNWPLDSAHYDCSRFIRIVLFELTFCLTRLLLLIPLNISVLFVGYKRWRWQEQRSFESLGHWEVLTLHLANMELLWGLGSLFYLYGFFSQLPIFMNVAARMMYLVYIGEIFFHDLTCAERYLAVVHPIIYRRLRTVRGTRIRNISIGFVWLSAFGYSSALTMNYPDIPFVPFLILFISSVIVASFCSIAVLLVLLRRGPGEAGRVDPAKQRAFYTIVAIMAMLWFAVLGFLIPLALHNLRLVEVEASCLMRVSGSWFSFPSSLVLPLLYVYKTKKPVCC